MIDLPLTWPLARYKFVFKVERPIELPDYAGSAFRGAFGRALRKTACMTRMTDCSACPLRSTCAYTSVFETPAPAEHTLQSFSKVPNPYVIEAPLGGRKHLDVGDRLEFSVVLFGDALQKLALIVYAMQRAFSYEVCRGKAALQCVCLEAEGRSELIYEPGAESIKPHAQRLTLTAPLGEADKTLRFVTPLRLQNNGKIYGAKDIEPLPFLTALVRRIGLLAEFHGDKPNLDYHALREAAFAVESSHALSWQNWKRYSSRQQKSMYLGGLVGTWTLSRVPEALQIFLELGSYLHVGKNATFGLGCYEILC